VDKEYHISITKNAIGEFFDQSALDEIFQANVSQDRLVYQLGFTPHFHFDNNKIKESLAYVDSQLDEIIELAKSESQGHQQRAAFGRLCHAIQDFYAHSNYIDLWLEENGGLNGTNPQDVNGLDEKLLNHPKLITGDFKIWRDIFYYIPLMNRFLRKIYIPPYSHEAMNLDNPNIGIKFEYAVEAAKQRTKFEFDQVMEKLIDCHGTEAIDNFLSY
jgi:hypothetical protein